MTDLTISALDSSVNSTTSPSAAAEKVPQLPKPVGPTAPPTANGVAHPLDAYVKGYPKIAARMSLIPETAMFRRFGALNALNLLYLQSDLAYIEKELEELECEDSKCNIGKRNRYAQNIRFLNTASIARDGGTKQRELVMRMRETLHQYNHALIQQSTVLKMQDPDPVDVRNMQCFYDSKMMDDGDTLTGPDRDIWGTTLEKDSHSKELVVLRPRVGTDSFSRKLSSYAIPLFEAFACAPCKKPDPHFGDLTIREDRVFKITLWTTSIVASLMPVLSIVILIKLEELNARLGAIAAFNVFLSICLLWFTDARRTDIFAVTAAFAAIQVVFVGQALDDGPKSVVVSNAEVVKGLCSC